MSCIARPAPRFPCPSRAKPCGGLSSAGLARTLTALLAAGFACGGALAQSPAVASATLPRELSPWAMFLSADAVVKTVMVGLALASVVTFTVGLVKGLELRGAKRRVRTGLAALAQARSLSDAAEADLGAGEVAELVDAARLETEMSETAPGDGLKERIASRIERIEAAQGRRMVRGTGVLATIGAIAPFIGLFGTVWGIMNSFVGISKAQTTNLAVVAPGIAEALLATAIGLFAAIPAVVIYNVFARAMGGYRALLADGAAEVLRLASRDRDRQRPGYAKAAE